MRSRSLPAVLLAAVVTVAAISISAATAQELSADLQREAQLASLGFIYYRHTPAPRPPSTTELAALDTRLASTPAERDLLIELYGEAADLLVYATRDSDGDGVRDYRVSEYYGKFMEGDIDVDGDGVRNIHDAHPYDGSIGGKDLDGNGIPDHLDWRLLGKGDDLAAMQETLFRDHEIILVERSAEFTPELARSVFDAITRIFARPLAQRSVLPSLRTIASEETCLLTAEVDDATNAMAVAQTQSLLVYRVGIDSPPLVQLGLVAHELGHNYQYSLDFDGDDLAAENVRVYFAAPRFHALVEPFGWKAEALVFDPVTDGYLIFTPQYFELSPFYTWRGRTTKKWSRWLARKYRRRGDGYLELPKVVKYHIVGDYSLTNPWEWYSDSLIAYTFLAIEGRVRQSFEDADIEKALAAMAKASHEAWPGFRYANLDREGIGAHLGQTFPMETSDLDYFVATYVRPLVGPVSP